MPLPTFPAYARLLREGFDESPNFGVQRSEMDGSVAKQRPRFSKPIVTRSATLLVDGQKAAFDVWFRDDLNGGAGWFSWRDPVDGATKNARIVSGKLQWRPVSPTLWQASVQIETLG